MRIDGLDNIEIPATINMSPAIETFNTGEVLKEKIANWLTGNGFHEVFTNSITNSKYFDEKQLGSTIKIINSLSEDLNIMRPSMIPTGLESISYNLNRKNNNLLLFEYGKIYSLTESGKYEETEKLSLYFTGNMTENAWKKIYKKPDIYFVKGVCEKIFALSGLKQIRLLPLDDTKELIGCFTAKNYSKGGSISKEWLDKFSIRQPVFYLEMDWKKIVDATKSNKISFEEILKFPQVKRDLSIVIDKEIPYQSLEDSIASLQITRLTGMQLFDVFENEKIGLSKKSFAITFTFSDQEKTLTDIEVDAIMNRIIEVLEKQNSAEIRRNN